MRLTITRKIVAGATVIVFLGGASMLIVHRGLSAVQQEMHNMAAIDVPIIAAAHELEINLLAIELGVLKHLDTGGRSRGAGVSEDQQEFARLHAEYMALVRTPELRRAAEDVRVRYEEFRALAEILFASRDRQVALLDRIAGDADWLRNGIDDRLRRSSWPRDEALMEALRHLREDIAQIGSGLPHYRERDAAEYRAGIIRTEREGRLALAQYDRMAGTGDDRRFGASLRQRFDVMMRHVSDVLVIESRLAESRLRFSELRRDINGLLDDQLQKLAVADASAPKQNADRTVSTVIRTSAVLIPLFLLTVAAVAALLTRSVTRPVHRLSDGTAAVAGGNLAHRITVSGDDELSDLAREFNAMVAQLEATTVSKAALQASERRLQETVGELRHEILERGRAEAAGASLERELRRSELMSAMGSLVAGVAHEVRNPLFGISSIIDALQARVAGFGASGEYARHMVLLRTELQRLTRLMQDLLDYGKPPSLELVPVALEEVVRAAMSACEAAAARQYVHVTQQIRASGVAVMIDRTRVVQVFQNLLDNAIQYTPAEGKVTLTVDCVNERGARWVRCRVEDSGPGFSDEDLSRVFEPFFTRRHGGTGLGLSIVLRIVEAHRGTVRAENRPGGGAAVEVRLPVVEVPAVARERAGA